LDIIKEHGKANTLYCLGEYDKAIECYEQVLKKFPNDAYSLEGKALAVHKRWLLIKEKEKGIN
jgi:tetratricopeptide (TPR) repeat protein